MEQKTIKEWLETLPEPYRTQALKNTEHQRILVVSPSLPDAVGAAFAWCDSLQGEDYWRSIFERAHKGEFDAVNDAVNDTVQVTGQDTAQDKQIGGSHYKDMKIQPSDFIRSNGIGWYEGNAIKYICRHQSKGGKQDIEKAIHYLEMIISEYDKQV